MRTRPRAGRHRRIVQGDLDRPVRRAGGEADAKSSASMSLKFRPRPDPRDDRPDRLAPVLVELLADAPHLGLTDGGPPGRATSTRTRRSLSSSGTKVIAMTSSRRFTGGELAGARALFGVPAVLAEAHRRGQQVILGLEVVDDQPGADVRAFGDVGHALSGNRRSLMTSSAAGEEALVRRGASASVSCCWISALATSYPHLPLDGAQPVGAPAVACR